MRIVFRLTRIALLLVVCVAGSYLSRHGRPRWAQRFLGDAARIAGVSVRVEGRLARDCDRGTALVLLANHVSWIDILVIAGATGTAFVAHDGLAAHPFLRWLCVLNRTVFIARSQRGTVAEQVARMRAALAQGEVLTLFPEGTTSDGVTLRPFKSALLAALEPPLPGLMVQPVALDYGPEAQALAWTGDEPGLRNFLRILSLREPVRLKLSLLVPLDATATVGRKAIAAAAQDRIADALARPWSGGSL